MGQRVWLRIALLAMLVLTPAIQPGAAEVIKSPSFLRSIPTNSASNRRGVPRPITVIAQLPPKSQAELALETRNRAEQREADHQVALTNRWLVGIGLAQVVVFLGQLVVFSDQARKLRKTVVAAEQQSTDMRESIRQSARAAAALEALGISMAKSAAAAAESVATVKERTALQMRAYLAVLIGTAVYQDSSKPLRFEAKPTLHNMGNTPASDVTYFAKAAILPVPLPEGFQLADGDIPAAGAAMGPHEQRIMSAIADGMVPDAEVEQIKTGYPRALYVWGIVKYKDIFGEPHETRFCQQIYWLGDKIMGYYIPGRNRAT